MYRDCSAYCHTPGLGYTILEGLYVRQLHSLRALEEHPPYVYPPSPPEARRC